MVRIHLAKLLSVRSLKKFGLWSIIGLVVFTLFGFFGFPIILKAVLTSQLTKLLHREAAIQEIHFNPFYMNNIELPKYVEYIPADLRFKLTSGSLKTELALSFVQHKEQASALAV